MKRVTLVITLCLGLLLGACAQAEPTPVPEVPPAAGNTITNIVWKWETLDDRAANSSTSVPNPDLYTIVFHQDGTTEGQADCNTFSGTYSQDGGFFITVRPDVMAACDQGSMDQQFLSLLGDIAAGGPDGAGGLALETAAGAQRMQFSDGGAAQ